MEWRALVTSVQHAVTQRTVSPIMEGERESSLMTLLQIPDDQAAALQARAAAQGLTLDAWLRRLAGLETPRPHKGRYILADLVQQCDLTVPLSDEDKVWLNTTDVGREAE